MQQSKIANGCYNAWKGNESQSRVGFIYANNVDLWTNICDTTTLSTFVDVTKISLTARIFHIIDPNKYLDIFHSKCDKCYFYVKHIYSLQSKDYKLSWRKSL